MRLITAALLTAYGSAVVEGTLPAIEARLTITPRRAASMCGSTASEQKSTAFELTASTLSQCSSVMSRCAADR